MLVAQYSSTRNSSTSGEIKQWLDTLLDPDTFAAWQAERAVIETLGADCNSAVAVFAEVVAEKIQVTARVLSPEGRKCLEDSVIVSRSVAREAGVRLGEALLSQGAAKLLRTGTSCS